MNFKMGDYKKKGFIYWQPYKYDLTPVILHLVTVVYNLTFISEQLHQNKR